MDGNANCEAWAFLLSDIIRTQGFQTTRLKLLTATPGEKWMSVKKMWEQAPLDTGDPTYRWVLGLNLHDLRPGFLLGNTAQGLHRLIPQLDPRKTFQVHYVTEFEDVLFDPSYGTPWISGPNRLKTYEDTYIEFYGIDAAGPQGQDVSVFRKNNMGSPSSEISSHQVFDR